ncbi:PTS sugar transporter subunit IIA [Weizmannia coagulans]|uniref:PTS sugar transporter subunit IIA n=3 Tax=Heyndrickxia TaxID=2837504 RepID=A0AAN0T9W4_HEYCO|nr:MULTISPECIES: PTS sugar transporter subunit IIA [Heyndrickxia]NWN95814.1 PTS sugar transporter subunit IIA [Bacillus sp. (in: firmicutes)]AEP00060.1 PTS system fructose subfamily IIA component [Heyndrickxia coagulans 36D1]AJO24400.1 PTS system fructose subfamily transporter subunit IIA [Heyndrickxia coagulans]AKN54137.1 N-acetylglucosamine/galactosamine PTS, EIIA [Heyndrickxia coagulans]ATW84238.1 PTS system fructose subfamily transporter subunit IIA [Heyndrickxia coagulans]
MIKFIVTGHGHFASGIQSTIKLLVGIQENIAYIDFPEGESNENLREKLEAELKDNRYDTYLFFCDLAGGTPYKEAATLSANRKDAAVTAGCNVGALLESIFVNEENPAIEIARQIVELSRKAATYFGEKKATAAESSEGEGI